VGLYYWLMNRARWGYNMRVVGGNPEAARRSGLVPSRYIVIAMMLGGAMAGLYGMIEVTAIQGRRAAGSAAAMATSASWWPGWRGSRRLGSS
jgi:simple sugar transport system permease protein